MILTSAERADMTSAIDHAEAGSSVEIFCVLSEQQNYYSQVALAWAVAVALLTPYLLWLAGVKVGMVMDHDWRAAHMTFDEAGRAFHRFGAIYTVLPLALFIFTFLAALVPPFSTLLVPRWLRRRTVRRAALEQFHKKGVHRTPRTTGVLIFTSLGDRLAEVVLDEDAYTEATPEMWKDVTAAVVTGINEKRIAAGLIAAIEIAGALLAKHFPPGADIPDKLRPKIIEI